MSERKKISIRNLKVSDMVVGQHVDNVTWSYNVVAGIITSISKSKEAITYNVRGAMFTRPFGEPYNFSGSLTESEIEVIDQFTCNTIIELYDICNKQIVAGSSRYHETVDKINEMRHKSRQELEEKYVAPSPFRGEYLTMDVSWRDLIDKNLVVEISGELHEVMVVRVSPNGTAVQFDFATGSALSDMRWVRADQVTILDTLDGS